jgi:hypothetical protein
VEVKKRVCREGKKNKNISGGRKWKVEAYMGEGGKCRKRVSAERGYFPAERGQVEPGVEEMKIEVKNRKFPRRSEWK